MTSSCRHGIKNRAITVTACWNELNFAVANGYILLRIFEAYQYSNEAPIFETFFNLLSREKIRYSEVNFDGTMEQYVDCINKEMNYPPSMFLTPNEITPHKIKRQHCKQNLNLVFGKLSQQNMRSKPILIKTQSDLDRIDLSSVENIFALEKACVLVIKNKSNSSKHNRRANSVLYSYVLAYSRVHMYKEIRKLQSKSATIFQISNDCLYFSYPKNVALSSLATIGHGFGFFRDEYSQDEIVQFVSFGTKSCTLKLINHNGTSSQIVKARGFSLTTISSRQIILDFDFVTAFQRAVLGRKSAIIIPQVRKRKTVRNLSIKQVLMNYQFSNCISKVRVIMPDGKTKPFGFI